MAFYSAAYDKAVSGTQTPAFHLAAAGAGAAGGSIRLVEVYVGGRDTSSTPFALAVNRPTASGAPTSAAGTAAPLDNNSGNHSFSLWGDRTSLVAYATTSPTPAASDVLNFGFNSYGGVVRWAALPGAEVVAVATATTAGTASGANLLLGIVRSANTGTLSGHFIIEQR